MPTAFITSLPPEIHDQVARWQLSDGASAKDIADAEAGLGISLPEDLAAFYRGSNGGSGTLGQTFVALEPVQTITTRGDDYDFGEFVPHLVLFGTNGGAEGFAVDRRTGHIVIVPLHEPGADDAIVQGTFIQLLERLATNTAFNPSDL